MYRHLLRAAAAAAAVSTICPGPSSAAGLSPSTLQPVVVQKNGDQWIVDYQQAMASARFADALAIVESIRVDPGNADGRGVLDAMRAAALFGMKRDADARALVDESNRVASDISEPSMMLFLGGLFTRRYDVGADALDRMIAKYPDAVRALDANLIRAFLANEPKDEPQRNDRRRIALARIGYGGDTERGHYLVRDAVNILVKDGDVAEAAKLLPSINEPVAIENMLIQKRFSALWPQLEQIAGEHLANVDTKVAEGAQHAYESDPGDHISLATYINALRHSGRLDDAIALRSKLPSDAKAFEQADEEMGWAINDLAYALFEAGKKDEADQLLAHLNDAAMDDGGWRISMRINRLEMLVSDGRYTQALPLLDSAENAAKSDGSAFARQLVRRIKFCTFEGLGRAADADKVKPDLIAHAADAPGPTIDALLCAGDEDGAEKVALAALANPDVDKRLSFEEDFVRQLQAHPLTSDDPSVWQGRWTEFRKRPAIAAAFARLGRDMPAEFLPVGTR